MDGFALDSLTQLVPQGALRVGSNGLDESLALHGLGKSVRRT